MLKFSFLEKSETSLLSKIKRRVNKVSENKILSSIGNFFIFETLVVIHAPKGKFESMVPRIVRKYHPD